MINDIDNKGRVRIQRILKDVIEDFLAHFGEDGWCVVEYGNPEIFSLDKAITYQLMRTRRDGFVASRYGDASDGTGGIERRSEWIETQSWQIQVIKKRKKGITEDTVLAEDVADTLIAWMNDDRGLRKFRENGVAPFRIDSNDTFTYVDDSEVYQKRAVFTVKLNVPKRLVFGEKPLDMIKPDVLPI